MQSSMMILSPTGPSKDTQQDDLSTIEKQRENADKLKPFQSIFGVHTGFGFYNQQENHS